MRNLFFPSMDERLNHEELMDRQDCSLKKLERTIKQFDLLNRLFSHSLPLYKKYILPTALKNPKKVWSFLDLGCGGADIDRALVRLFRKHSLKIKITAIDLDERLIPWAQKLCKDYPEIDVVQGNAFELEQYENPDFIISNHVLHHLPFEQVKILVLKAQAKALCGCLFNDLRRSVWAYLGYTIFTGLFIHRSLAFYDGRLSIRRGFTLQEMIELFRSLPEDGKPFVGKAEPARVFLFHCKDLNAVG